MLLQNIMPVLSKVASKTCAVLKDKAPQILLGGSIACTVGGTVLACRSTLKTSDILTEKHKQIEDLRAIKEETVENSVERKTVEKEISKTYISAAGAVAKQFAPAVIIEVAGIAMGIKSYSIMHNRLAVTTEKLAVTSAALGSLTEQFQKYRERTRARVGSEVENAIYYDMPTDIIEEVNVDENGKKHKTKAEKMIFDKEKYLAGHRNAKFFDETCDKYQWLQDERGRYTKPDTPMNLLVLNQLEEMINRENQRLGGISVRQAMQMIEPSWQFADKDTLLLGWGPDDHIDLGLHNQYDRATRRFVNGLEDIFMIELLPTRALCNV